MDVVAEPVAKASQEKPKAAAKVAGPTTGVTVPMPGKILDIQVNPGDKVKPGQVVLVLEAMKMENSITAEIGGTVNEIFVEVGDTVAADTKVLDLVEA
jgi:biotin carboxyl carrier protein